MQYHQITIEKNIYNLYIKRNRQAKRITLSYNLKKHAFIVTIPQYIAYKSALSFVEQHTAWMKNHPYLASEPLNFATCQEIKICHLNYAILDNSRYQNKFHIFHDKKIIEISSKDLKNRAQCLIDCLKYIALEVFTSLSQKKSSLLGVNCHSISIMDQKKWGSCSVNGDLKYNFRIVMAPLHVIDYLVSHEVAHLKEFNHSQKFWNIVKSLYSYDDINTSKEWLKHYPHTLY